MIEFVSQSMDALATRIAQHKDDLIRSEITHFLGRDDWTMEEIRKRAVWVNSGLTTQCFYLDGINIATFHFEVLDHDENSQHVKAGFRAQLRSKEGRNEL